MPEEVGGFFASLRLMTDESSFQRGTSHIKSLSDKLSGLVMWAAGLIGLAEGIKAVVAAAAQAQDIAFSAERFGISFKALKEWQGAWAETGGTLKDVTTMMEQLQRKQVEIFKQGKGSMDWQAISMLGLDPGATARQSAPQMAAAIINAAEAKIRGGADQGTILKVVDDLLGASASKQVQYDVAHKTSLDARMKALAGSVYETGGKALEGGAGVKELTDLRTKAGNFGEAIGSKIMANLTDVLKSLNSWLTDNQGLLTELTDNIANLAKVVAVWVSNVLKTAIEAQGDPDFTKGGKYSRAAGHPLIKFIDEAEKKMITGWVESGNVIARALYGAEVERWRGQSSSIAAIPGQRQSFDFTVMGKLYDQSGKVVGELSKKNSKMAVQQ